MVSFINLIDKSQPNLLLGHLFVESGMVPEKCLDAALKLQEYVRQGKITNESAIIALKRLAVTGSELSEELIEWAKNPDKSPPPAGRPSFNEPRPRPRDNPAMQKVIELLQQAGLVSEADLETARKVKSKHGGDLGQILVSAGKIGGKTLEAATECQIYIQHSRLRVDKAIMALHYCERMRVGFKEACEELTINLE